MRISDWSSDVCSSDLTGRARQGSLRSVQFRGGSTIHGPVVRDHAHELPKKVRRLAMKAALSAKQAEGKLVVLKEAKLKSAKPKDLVGKLASIGWSKDRKSVVSGTSVEVRVDLGGRGVNKKKRKKYK